ncbi:MAG: transposase [Pseudomonadota bacterium]
MPCSRHGGIEGFHVFCGNRISPDDETAMENLARYIIRASFSQERMQSLDQEGKVVYTSKDGRTSKSFPALEWLVAMSSHIPNRGEQMVRYYGYYSNVSRGKRQKEGNDDAVPSIIESQGDEKIFRRNWARLIQKIYEADPLVCPKCQGAMRIISSIEDPSVIRDILKYLGIWLVRSRPPPKIHDPPVCTGRPAATHIMDDYCCQLPVNDDHLYSDPEYSCDQYIQA